MDRERLAAVVGAWWDSVSVVVRATSPHPLDLLADSLMPVVDDIAELRALERAAAELRKAAEGMPDPMTALWLTTRADVLEAQARST